MFRKRYRNHIVHRHREPCAYHLGCATNAANSVLCFCCGVTDILSWFVAAGISIFLYLNYLADQVFRNSMIFPFVLSMIGLGVFFAGVQYQQHQETLRGALLSLLPKSAMEIQRLSCVSSIPVLFLPVINGAFLQPGMIYLHGHSSSSGYLLLWTRSTQCRITHSF